MIHVPNWFKFAERTAILPGVGIVDIFFDITARVWRRVVVSSCATLALSRPARDAAPGGATGPAKASRSIRKGAFRANRRKSRSPECEIRRSDATLVRFSIPDPAIQAPSRLACRFGCRGMHCPGMGMDVAKPALNAAHG